ILSWGANTHSSALVSCQYLFDHARTLVSDLCLERKITQDSDAARQGDLKEHRSIKLSTYGVISMGTPHQSGSVVALGRLMVNVASVFAADDRLLRHLKQHSELLQQQLQQLEQYRSISEIFVTKFAYEEYKTTAVLGHSILVSRREAVSM
ncbi:hypothetical protein EK21DRAFT_81196, partial [Setomelanomma holmii]